MGRSFKATGCTPKPGRSRLPAWASKWTVKRFAARLARAATSSFPGLSPGGAPNTCRSRSKTTAKLVFQQDFLPRVEPIPRVREFLLHLQQAGIRLALASSASKEDLLVYKKIAQIEDLIEEESSADDADRSKPHPDIFVATLDRLHLKPAETLALGDTPYDAEAAGKAGIWTIGVETGGWTRKELLEAGCLEVYRDVGELLDCFDQSALARAKD